MYIFSNRSTNHCKTFFLLANGVARCALDEIKVKHEQAGNHKRAENQGTNQEPALGITVNDVYIQYIQSLHIIFCNSF